MQKNTCIFCRIISGELPSVVVWRDKDHIAFLDLNPNVEGMTLVVPRKHYPSYAFRMPDAAYTKLMRASKRVGALLEKGLRVKRVALVMEGMGIDHTHIKLYPLHGLTHEFTEMWAKGRVFFKEYPGYLSTKLGPQQSQSALQRTAKKIRRK